MILTNKQKTGLEIAVARYKAREPWTTISGYAGSGKSTLVKFIIAALNIAPEEVCYVAFTGKAAMVLKQKGCENAKTAHKLLYYARPTPSGKFIFVPRKEFEEPYKIIVVDEISMLPRPMWELLLRHKVYVLALGDPEQLPPINPEDDNHVLDNPHVFLDEIMRQAQESEIIRLSMHVREGKPLGDFKAAGAQVQIYSPNQVVDGMYGWADQILCATNQKRTQINNFIRKQKGFGEAPEIGDKIISLRNHWSEISTSGSWALTNGAIGTIEQYNVQKMSLPRYISQTPVEIMRTDIVLDDEDKFIELPIDYQCLLTGVSPLTPKQIYLMSKSESCPSPPFEFAYAYAITTWKAQGSEWDKVLGIEEGFPFDAETHKKFLYTMITRAKDKLVIIKNKD